MSNPTRLQEFIAQIARLNYDGEDIDGEDFVMENDDAVTTLSTLIQDARVLLNDQNMPSLSESEPPVSPAACPECHSTENVEAQGWVMARYQLVIGDNGALDYPEGAAVEWDACRPYDPMPPDIREVTKHHGVEELWCQACEVAWWYQLPDGPTDRGRFLGLVKGT